MTTGIKHIGPVLKYASIFAILGGILSQTRTYRDFVARKTEAFTKPSVTRRFSSELKEYCRREPDSENVFDLVSCENYNEVDDSILQVSPVDVYIARSNIYSSFAHAFTQKEEYPIGYRDLKILLENPLSLFAEGLMKNPKLKEVLEKDPKFRQELISVLQDKGLDIDLRDSIKD